MTDPDREEGGKCPLVPERHRRKGAVSEQLLPASLPCLATNQAGPAWSCGLMLMLDPRVGHHSWDLVEGQSLTEQL